MSAAAAPPLWVLALPLAPGAWRVLVGLWTFASFSACGPQLVGPSRAVLAARIGISTRTLRTQLATLRALGWIRDEDSSRFGSLGIRLAWMEPDNFGDEDAPAEVSRQAAEVSRSTAEVGRGRGKPVTGRGQPPEAAEVGRSDRPRSAAERPRSAAKPAEVGTQTLQGLADLAGGPCARAPDRVDRELDALTDPRQQRHAAIVAEQRSLAAKRLEQSRAPAESVAPANAGALTPEHRKAVREVGDVWAFEVDMRGGWASSLAEVIELLGLSPAQVASVLERWDAAWASMAPDERAKVDAGAGPIPPRRGVWWGRWASWRAEVLAQLSAASKPTRSEPASSWITDPCALPPRRRSEVLPC